MAEMKAEVLDYIINDPLELNLSYMPFIKDGGLFIPTSQSFPLGKSIIVNLKLPGLKENLQIEGKVVWITPKHSLHQVLAGIGIQFTGANTQATRTKIEANLDTSMEVGGYTYGMVDEEKKEEKKKK